MSEFYKAKIDDLTKEQLAEIINHQTSLHVESKALLVLAKEELQSRDAEIVRLEKELSLYDSDVRHFNAQIEKRDKLLERYQIATTGTIDYGHLGELRKEVEQFKK